MWIKARALINLFRERTIHILINKKKSFHSIVENNKIFILVYLSMLYLYIMNLYHEKCSMIQFLNNIRIYVCIVEKNYTHVYVYGIKYQWYIKIESNKFDMRYSGNHKNSTFPFSSFVIYLIYLAFSVRVSVCLQMILFYFIYLDLIGKRIYRSFLAVFFFVFLLYFIIYYYASYMYNRFLSVQLK